MHKVIMVLCFLISLVFSESLWQGERAGLFDDHRAKQVGDSLTVLVLETVSSRQSNGNTMGNANSVGFGPGTGYADFISSETSFANSSTHRATGEQTSAGELKAEVTVKVRSIAENGELVIYGDKVTNINGDKKTIEISGVVRPESIMPGNCVYSSALADARISFSQDGELRNNDEPSLINKIFNMVF
jgi:flagellar L-ring protein precursor FlgH